MESREKVLTPIEEKVESNNANENVKPSVIKSATQSVVNNNYQTFGSEAIAPQPIIQPIESEQPRIVKERSGFRYACYRITKRVFDFVASLLLLLVLSPIILLALAIKWIEDGGNPVYVQKRVGKNGKEFNFYKIRSMCVGAEFMKDALISTGKNESDGPVFKIKEDPRITKVGAFYRRWSIDELLQLVNIINGSMSIVGPRPPLPREVKEYTEEQKQRLMVKGGLLCLWQIQKNRNQIKFEEWVKLDLDYIEKRNFWLDIKIIFKGAYMVLFDRTGE